VVTRDPKFRKQTRSARIREYFYGPKGDLAPHRMSISMNEVEIYQIGQGACVRVHTRVCSPHPDCAMPSVCLK